MRYGVWQADPAAQQNRQIKMRKSIIIAGITLFLAAQVSVLRSPALWLTPALIHIAGVCES
jgi:hypothetical protein